jgi:outer membrane protein assembly factor BamB
MSHQLRESKLHSMIRFLVAVSLAFTLSACSSVVEYIQPAEKNPLAELTDFDEKVALSEVWKISLAENDHRLHLYPAISNDRQIIWRQRVSSEVLSTPVMDDQRVIVRTIDGKVTALSLTDGAQLWQFEREIPALTLRGSSSPVLQDGVVYFGLAGGRLVALNAETGAVVWDTTVSVPRGRSELERLADIDAPPVLLDGVAYVSTFQGQVAAINARNGQAMWRRNFSSYRAMDTDRKSLYAADDKGLVWAFDLDTGAARWRQEGLKNRQTSDVVSLGGVVIAGDIEGYLHVMSAADGAFLGRIELDDPIESGLVAINGYALVQDRGGRLTLLKVSAQP